MTRHFLNQWLADLSLSDEQWLIFSLNNYDEQIIPIDIKVTERKKKIQHKVFTKPGVTQESKSAMTLEVATRDTFLSQCDLKITYISQKFRFMLFYLPETFSHFQRIFKCYLKNPCFQLPQNVL